MSPIVERIILLVEKDDLNATQIASKLGITHSSFSDWKRGKAKPSIETIVKLANYFNVSTDYLLCGKASEIGLNSEISEIIDLYNTLSISQQQECNRILKYYIDMHFKNIHMESITDRRNA